MGIDVTELKFKLSEVGSYMANAALAMWGVWDWDKIAFITGILLGVLTFFVNTLFAYRRDRRESKALEAGLTKRAGP